MTKRMQYILGVSSVAFLILSFITTSTNVFAQQSELSDEVRSTISMNCGSLRQSLKSLQQADSKTRVILGTTYQSILSNYISPLNARLVKNNTPNIPLTEIQGDFVAARDDFTARFIKYSQSLETLIAIDCQNDPDGFYHQLERVRKEREKLSASVEKVNEAINDHKEVVTQFKDSLEKK